MRDDSDLICAFFYLFALRSPVPERPSDLQRYSADILFMRADISFMPPPRPAPLPCLAPGSRVRHMPCLPCRRSAVAVVLAALSSTLAQLPGQQANGGAEPISPLIQALVDDNVTLANMLLAAGADVATLDTITPLYAAQEYVSKRKARHAMLRKLLAAGSQVDQATQDGTTTLMLAAYNGDVPAVAVAVAVAVARALSRWASAATARTFATRPFSGTPSSRASAAPSPPIRTIRTTPRPAAECQG